MTRTFIQTEEFSKRWDRLGFDDDDLRKLELELLYDPEAYPVIRGTGGLRKIRVSFKNSGKSGSSRVCYVDFIADEIIYLITVYSKDEKDNLTRAECNEIKKAIGFLKASLKEGRIL